jgi:hypothetical protein
VAESRLPALAWPLHAHEAVVRYRIPQQEAHAMTIPTTTLLSATIAAVLACGTASAAAGDVARVEETTTTTDTMTGRTTTTTSVRFEDYDADADGIIVEREIPDGSGFAEVWVKYDADRDLRITPVEFERWTPATPATQRIEQTTVSTDAQGNTTTTTSVRFEDFDTNTDGVIVQAEVRPDSEFAGVWKRYDVDGDLRLTPVEFKAYTVGTSSASMRQHTSSVVNADGSTTQLTTTTRIEFADWDRDADGVLIKSEIPTDSGFATVWSRYDADRNLEISPSEFDAWLVVVEDDE